MQPKRVAIVGSGISGLAALWALKSTDHEVHLYEAEDRLGGHTNTVVFQNEGQKINVDTGFIVCNAAAYLPYANTFFENPQPANFLAFLRHLKIPTVATSMTFSISRDNGSFEWAWTSLNSLFAQRRNILRPSFWRMLLDIARFNQFALDLLIEGEEDGASDGEDGEGESARSLESIGEYLERNEYLQSFRNDYLIPMIAAVWSTGPNKRLFEFPASTLVRIMYNYQLLATLSACPTWLTIPDGARTYISALLSFFPASRIHTSTPIYSLSTNPTTDTVALRFADGRKELFDHVILATHGDQAAKIVGRGVGASELEKKVLGGFATTRNIAILHSDTNFLPTCPLAQASWNYLSHSPSPANPRPPITLTYNLTQLQRLPPDSAPIFPNPILLTLNPTSTPDPSLTHSSYTYSHPVYNSAAICSQKLLHKIQNRRGVSYAGAWTGYGLHEDGFTSGVRVAVEHLGAKVPFDVLSGRFVRGRPVLGWRDYAVRVFVVMVQLVIVLLSGGSWRHQKAPGKKPQ
ncbi:hypothetical protein FGG08_001836 [Glutinoglossum americanum]|uniref:Amine oxidase domain-containing protein n=1 Tax=Glutinoglossum americanum TaxID=1670608 RepID=A0A9P8IE47_9PEZI|nr:hypothetical protein FGG08_001836 [Glutinoglossum americanum]